MKMKTEEYKDQGLRQALQHKNEAAERMTLPDDFTDRLMQRIEQKEENPKHRSTWLYAAIGAVAAGILLLLALHYTPNGSNTEDATMVAQQTEQTEQRKQPSKPESPSSDIESQQTELQSPTVNTPQNDQAPMMTQEKPRVAKVTSASQQTHAASAVHKTANGISTTDSLDYYIDKIERELAHMDESLYIERMNKVIRADERLQRMVSSYIMHNLDKEGRPQTADNMYNVKTEDEE